MKNQKRKYLYYNRIVQFSIMFIGLIIWTIIFTIGSFNINAKLVKIIKSVIENICSNNEIKISYLTILVKSKLSFLAFIHQNWNVVKQEHMIL